MTGFQVEDNVAIELTFKKLFAKLWPFLSKHKPKIAVSVFLVFSFAAVGRALPFLFGRAVDLGIRQNHHDIVVHLAIAYLLVECVRAFLAFAQTNYIQHYGNQVLFEIREKLVSHVQRLPLTYFDKNPSGRIMTRVTVDVFALGELFSQGFAAIFIAIVEMATIFLSLAILSWKLTGMTLIVLPFLIWGCRTISMRIRFQFGAAKRKLSTINAYAAESVSGMKVLQLFHRQKVANETFDNLSAEYRYLQLKTISLFAMLWPLIETFNLFALSSSLLLTAYFFNDIGLSVGEVSTFILLLQGFFKPFKVILERYNQLQNSLASADRVFQILGEIEENQAGADASSEVAKGLIEFKDVTFRYSESAPLVLDNISIRIEPGTSVALVGRTGSGKSTIISLIQKMYCLKQGSILIDGQNIQEMAIHDLRSRIGVVQQDNFIFSGTILYNITLGDARISQERAAWAAERAQCMDLIQRHGGFCAMIQERGANLSVGERQLIAFARALAFDPEILIMDEATANIDSMNEEKIQNALRNVIKGRTSLIIAHRLSTVMDCDQILLLDKGHLVQSGSHAKLINEPGPYRDLCLSHFGSEDPKTAEL
jgi:ATP-binding cassette, subfamily B, multidrug efflux pump